MNNTPFLKKLFIAFFLIATGYAFIVAGVWLYKNNEIHEVKQEGEERNFIHQARSQMDMKFMVALNLIQELKSNDDIIKYAADSENYYYVNNVYNRLKSSTIAFNNFGYKIDVMEKSAGLVITPNKTIDTDSYYKEMGFTSEHLQKIEDYFLTKSTTDMLFIRHVLTDPGALPDRNSFTIIKKETVDYTSEITFIITFAEKLFFSDWQMANQAGIGFLLNKELMLSKSDLGEEKIRGLLSDDKFIGEVSSYLKTETGSFHIHSTGSALFDEVAYFYITPMHPFIGKIKSITWEAGTLYLLLLLLGFGAAIILSRKIYKPIRHVVSSIWNLSEIGGKDEFFLIREKISTLQSSNDELEKAMLQNSKVWKRTYIRDLAYGALSEEQLNETPSKHGLEWLARGGSILLFRWTGEDMAMNLNKSELAAIENQVVDRIRLLISPQLEWFENRTHNYVFLVDETATGTIKKSMSQIMYEIHEEYGISMLVSIGQSAANIREWEQSFHTATSMLEDHSALDRQSILTYDEYTQVNNNQYYYPLELERDIIHMVIQRKKEQLEALIYHIFQENIERREIGRDMQNQLVHSLYNTLRRILQQLNETEASLFGQGTNLLKEMKSSGIEKGLKDTVLGMFAAIIDHVHRKNEEVDESMSDRMMTFIHDNYQRDISLVDLSEEFNASPAYISILFKNYTGENFKDYLNMYRVKIAKDLLQNNSHLKIHEVAGRVGCNHPNTFIRMFKKYEGVSPGLYAKQFPE